MDGRTVDTCIVDKWQIPELNDEQLYVGKNGLISPCDGKSEILL